jgi:predicted nucleotidyltransferase component of viral defense system
MNSLSAQFSQILDFARQYRAPVTSPRAIIREYLQSQVIGWMYGDPRSTKLSFVGGTALRLLRGIDRFSEDLDFDNLGVAEAEMDGLLTEMVRRFEAENIEVELAVTHRGEKNYYELRFPHLLYELGITTNDKEKLKIKLDYSRQWRGQQTETVLFNRYGQIAQVVTNPLSQLLVQKLAAYVGRRQTQPRDMYDVVWLFAQGARVDREFMRVNGLDEILIQARQKYEREGLSRAMRDRLQPFLFLPENLSKLDLFPTVVGDLGN